MRHGTRYLAPAIGLLCALCATAAGAGGFGFFGTYWDTDEGGDSAGLAIRYEHRFSEHWALDARWYWYFW